MISRSLGFAYLFLQEALEDVYPILEATLTSLHRKGVCKDYRASLTFPVAGRVGFGRKTQVNLVELILPEAWAQH